LRIFIDSPLLIYLNASRSSELRTKYENFYLSLLSDLRVERSYRGIERLVQLVIQAMLDLGLMFISALKGKRPKAYSEIGYILQDLDVLEERETKKAIALLRQAVERLSVSKGGEA